MPLTDEYDTIGAIQLMLDELFALRHAIASLSLQREEAIAHQLPSHLQEIVKNILREFAEREVQLMQEEKMLGEKIRTEATPLGRSIQGTHLQTIYQLGHITWDKDGLERLAEQVPEIWTYRKEGKPFSKIIARTRRRPPSSLMYDIHG